MSTDPAIEAEVDRLGGVYLRLRTLAQAHRIDVMQAGEAAVAKGLISARDWSVVRKAINERRKIGAGGQEGADGSSLPEKSPAGHLGRRWRAF
jgi:hypothetical protein